MADIRCSVLKSDFIVAASQSAPTRIRNMAAGGAVPYPNLAVDAVNRGSADFSGRVFIRGEGMTSPEAHPYGLAINRIGGYPQLVVRNALINPPSSTWVDYTRTDIFMNRETTGMMLIRPRCQTTITPYLTLGDSLCPVRVEGTNRGDSVSGALVVTGGICAKKPSAFMKCTVDYGPVINIDYASMFLNAGPNAGMAGYYPFLRVHNSPTMTETGAVWSGVLPHVNFMWKETDVSATSECAFSINTANGLSNSVITIGNSTGTNTSTDPTSTDHYYANVLLPSPLTDVLVSHTGAALDVAGGVYVGGAINFNSGLYTSAIRFGSTDADAFNAYESRTLGTLWTSGTDTFAQTVSYQKAGRIVTLALTATALSPATGTVADSVFSLNATLPASIRPAADAVGCVYVRSGTTVVPARMAAGSAGALLVSGFDSTLVHQFLCSTFSYRSAS